MKPGIVSRVNAFYSTPDHADFSSGRCSGGRAGRKPVTRQDGDQRDHYRDSADDLSEIREIVETHSSQLL